MQNALDLDISAASFVVIDFETVTPRGRPPEPIEVAAIRTMPGLGLQEHLEYESLICPPIGAPITPFDTKQTGIRTEDVANAPAAPSAIREVDQRLGATPFVLAAHNAPYESGILKRFGQFCPQLTAAPVIDTVALARIAFPELPTHSLDVLAQHLSIPLPPNRHRAMPDVRLTLAVMRRALHDWSASRSRSTVRDLLVSCSKPMKQDNPQASLFD